MEVFQSEEIGMIDGHAQFGLGIFLFVLNSDFQEKRRQIIRCILNEKQTTTLLYILRSRIIHWLQCVVQSNLID